MRIPREDTSIVEVDPRMPELEVLRLATSFAKKEFGFQTLVDIFKLSDTKYQVILYNAEVDK